VTGLLLRRAQTSRAGAQGDDDYDVIGTDGMVIGRIFKATTSPAGTPWMWTLAYGDHEDRTPRTDMRRRTRLPWRHSRRAGGGNEKTPSLQRANCTVDALHCPGRFRTVVLPLPFLSHYGHETLGYGV